MKEANQLTTLKTIQSRANNGWKEYVAPKSSEEILEEGPRNGRTSEMQPESQMTDVIGVSGEETERPRAAATKEIQNHEENTSKKSS